MEFVKKFYRNLRNVGDSHNDKVELKTKINKIVIKFDDQILGQILNLPTAKLTNILCAEHRLLHHIISTHILPTSGGHEKMIYQDLYSIWHIVIGKPLNLAHLIMKNMLRAISKVDGSLPYGMVITKIFSHFGFIVGNEVSSRIDVGDIYNASSLKRIGWKRVHTSEGFV
ncbi:hypothetical protein CFOL_v3_12233 [Cephalotus follicularis]|uniref:Putative plant transposon protein domain-containing protein n=1 Tax=Cephalotus follicularis TaxID=3775 RepID=A0A1Q3BL36_CEPFO|nr:hypothetical protein CFOL_v3_12233 [Cephalotus follicularis]